MRRDIQVAHGEENEVGKALKVAKSRSSIFDELDDPVQSFSHRIGQVPVDEVLKDEFEHFRTYKNKRWITAVLRSRIPTLKTFARTMRKHFTNITATESRSFPLDASLRR